MEENEKKIAQLKKQAEKLIDKVQKRISNRGAYENAGVKEEQQFSDLVSKAKLHYQEQCKLMQFISEGMRNLNY